MCAHAVRVAIEKFDGINAVKVSLNEGMATIQFKPQNHVTVQEIREAIRKNGFTPKAAQVQVAGRLTEDNGALVLAVPGTAERFVLQDASEAQGTVAALQRQRGTGEVTITGDVPAPAKPQSAAPLHLLVRSFSSDSAATSGR